MATRGTMSAELDEDIVDEVPHQVPLVRGTSGARPFSSRHIGPQAEDIEAMLKVVGFNSLDQLCDKTVPEQIRLKQALQLGAACGEAEVLRELRAIASENKVFCSFIGHGYYDTVTPPVIQRNILENPGWYTQYTPYQAEIAQGRLEALVNFQTMISDLTGMQIANSSLLDEGTAAAEAMMLAFRLKGSDARSTFLLSDGCHDHVKEVVRTRAEPLGIEVKEVSDKELRFDQTTFAGIVTYPKTDGSIVSYAAAAKQAHDVEAMLIVASDLLALTLLQPPGEWGADVVVGSSQRFGVPLGFGGPHAAFFATRDEFRRELPGRLVGVSKDAQGKIAYRLALQTREQHIRRDKATSNICTAQVLLAVIASMYGVYHGPAGLRRIAEEVHQRTNALAGALSAAGFTPKHKHYFDTLQVELGKHDPKTIKARLERAKVNVRWFSETTIGISIDEAKTCDDIEQLFEALSGKSGVFQAESTKPMHSAAFTLEKGTLRTSDYLSHPVFHRFQSETELLRYIRRLESRDLSLTTSMIPLGSCTMKLNASAEMFPISWPEFAKLHPFAPAEQTKGYRILTSQLESMLAAVTGLPGVSLQPNAGSQGEYAGLLVIRAFQKAQGQGARHVCLIPMSAHGTNPASAVMAGLQVIAVACDSDGNVDLADLKKKAAEHAKELSCLMVTYPSTHGVFEEGIKEICETVHANGGLVYMDGANLNAQLGLCRPGDFGVDVCHLNLHKTFCIPHGGGGPGIGPIACSKELADFLPGHFQGAVGGKNAISAVASAPWGSAGILPIPWVYIRMMGPDGLKQATQVAILNANYIAKRLEGHYDVLYRGKNKTVAHECILDLRHLKRQVGLEAADIAKRLMDYGFHAPTVSFPVVETLMVEPTESESRAELDRFCDALILIKAEIDAVASGRADKTNNVLKNAPHTAEILMQTSWPYPYSREEAGYPAPWLREHKFFPAVSRIDNAYGDRNLFCSCAPMEA